MKRATLLASAILLGALAATPLAAQRWAYLSANLLGSGFQGGGDAEGDVGADFNGEADLERGKLCYYLDFYGIEGITAAQIHEGDGAGLVVVELPAPKPDGEEVCVDVDKALLARIAENPKSFSIDIRTSRHPDGAVRGELSG